MTDDDFLVEMRRRINPIYADQIGTESWERKRVLAIIEKLEAERDAMANPIGDHALISVPRKDFRRIEAERDALAAQVVAMRDALELMVAYAREEGKGLRCADEALSLDTSQAEAILRERDAKVLELAAKKFRGEVGYNFVCADGYSNAFDIANELDFMAAERREG